MPRRRWRDEDAAHTAQELDPYGIYGTRSEQRLVGARQRRVTHQLVTLFALAGLAAASLIFSRRPHVPVIKGARVAWAQALGAAPILASDGAGATRLLLPAQGGDLQSFDPASGKLTSLLDTAFPLRATPVVRGNVAYAPCEDGSLYAVDWRSGSPLWQHATGAPLSARPALVTFNVPVHPPLLGNAQRSYVIIGNDAGTIQCLEAGNGHVAWQRQAGAPVGAGLIAVPGKGNQVPCVLIPLMDGTASRGGLLCLDSRSGAVQWKFPQGANVSSPQLAPPALDLAGGRLFCGDDTGAMICLRLRDGARLWKNFARPRPGERGVVLLRGEPLFVSDGFGERVVVGGNDGLVRGFDANNGRLLWSYDAGAPVRCLPLTVQSNGRSALLVGCDGPRVWLIDAQSGVALRELRTDGAASFAPLPWNNTFYVATARGSIEKFRF